jgi:MFS superfamily sulfate permease-like transporter
MPVCHGAGGLTAHRAFGARTAAAPLMMGGALLVLALGLGAGLAGFLAAFPLPVLAGMLAAAGFLHLRLLEDLEGRAEWAVVAAVGLVGVTFNLGAGLALGLAAWWLPRLATRRLAPARLS